MSKLFFGFFILVVAGYLCVELIPPYYTNYELQDAVNTEALLSTNSSKTEDAIRDSVFKKVQELEIPITKDKIVVHRSGLEGSGSVNIEVPYTVHLNLAVHPVDLHFDVVVTNRGAF